MICSESALLGEMSSGALQDVPADALVRVMVHFPTDTSERVYTGRKTASSQNRGHDPDAPGGGSQQGGGLDDVTGRRAHVQLLSDWHLHRALLGRYGSEFLVPVCRDDEADATDDEESVEAGVDAENDENVANDDLRNCDGQILSGHERSCAQVGNALPLKTAT